MNKKTYKKLVKSICPKEEKLKNVLISFISGGFIGIISTIIYTKFLQYDFDSTTSIAYTLVILILSSSVLTGLGIMDSLVEKLKCGLIIPITGFAHSLTSEAIDSKNDGLITGIGASIFKLAGSVLLYGMFSAFILTIIRVIIND